MSGIFRDVYLLKRPAQGIFDYFLTTDIAPDGKSASVDVAVTYFNEAVPVKISVYNAEGSLEAESSRVSEDGRIRMTLENPVLWNAEEPYLYKVVLEAAERLSQTIWVSVKSVPETEWFT